MARVTSAGQAENLKRKINTALENLEKAQMRVSSGLRIQKPSDDPAGLRDAFSLRTSIARSNQFVRNVDNNRIYLKFQGLTICE